MKIFALLHSARASRAPKVHSCSAGHQSLVRRQLTRWVGVSALLLAPAIVMTTADLASAGRPSHCGGSRPRSTSCYRSQPRIHCGPRVSCAPRPIARPPVVIAPPVVVRPPVVVAPPVAIYPPTVGPWVREGLRYVVAIPSNDPETLAFVRRIAPGAFFADSRLGTFINAGAYTDRDPAETQADVLRAYGFDAQVRHRDF